jgi:spore germination protein YaaH
MTSMVRAVLLVALALGLVTTDGLRVVTTGQGLSSPAPGAITTPSTGAAESTLAPVANPLADQEVFGFLPYWEVGRADGIDLETLTTLAWFDLEAGRDGRLIRETADGEPTPGWAGWTSEAFDELIERARAAGVRVVITVERFAWDVAGRRNTKALLADPTARAVLIADILDVIASRGVGGVNLDFEPLPRKVRDDFVRLVRELRAALDAVDPSLQLTFDLTADVTSYPLRRLVADGAADAAVLMGYEYRTPGSRVAGSVAPLRDPTGLDLRESVKRARSRAPADRLILALPWYGRAWSTKTDEPGARTRRGERFISPSTALYRVSVPRAASAGRNYDREQASAWSVYPSRACEECPLSWRQLWYDDTDSVRAKVGLARRQKLRGVGIWALGYHGARPELWSALRYSLGREQDGVPPIGGAEIAPESVIGERDGTLVVAETVTLEVPASDGIDGSGIAFVRVATRGRLNSDGSLKHGTTFPAVESVTISMPGADPVGDVFVPGGAASAEPAPDATPGADGAPAPEAVLKVIRVQWRDIAGNWSAPVNLRVYYVATAESVS